MVIIGELKSVKKSGAYGVSYAVSNDTKITLGAA